MRRCAVCQQSARMVTSPAELFGLVPVAVLATGAMQRIRDGVTQSAHVEAQLTAAHRSLPQPRRLHAVRHLAAHKALALTRVVAVAAAAGGGLVAALHYRFWGLGVPSISSKPQAPYLISLAAARQVVIAYDSANNAVLKSNSVAANDRIEEGILGQADDAAYANTPYLDETPAGPYAFSEISVMVPQQSAYPGYFIATETAASSTTTPSTWLLLFKQDTKASPWRACSSATLLPGTVLHFQLDAAGYGVVGTGAGLHLAYQPATVASDLVAYLQAAQTTATPPLAIFASNSLLLGQAQGTYANAHPTPANSTQSATAAPDGPPLVFPTQGGGALVLGWLAVQDAQDADSGVLFSQTPAEPSWGLVLPPGQYTQIVTTRVSAYVALIPAASATNQAVAMVGDGVDIISQGGTG